MARVAVTRVAAVVLAGGGATRLGGRDKPMVAVGGVPMIARVLAAVGGVGGRPRDEGVNSEVVVVGPRRDGLPPGVRVVREDPPGGGPVAAAAAGLALVEADVVVLLAADLPCLTADAVELLVEELVHGGGDGALFVDERGRRQLLCGVWRTTALRAALARLGEPSGRPMRALLDGLDTREVRWTEPGQPPYFDCDTDDDLRRAEGA
jgi:molybdopterin-guanine dinucleotide biosynthesis protein A